jgi:hypothetical protein
MNPIIKYFRTLDKRVYGVTVINGKKIVTKPQSSVLSVQRYIETHIINNYGKELYV